MNWTRLLASLFLLWWLAMLYVGPSYFRRLGQLMDWVDARDGEGDRVKASTVALLAFLSLAGCATTLSPEYQASLDSWVGAPVVDFFEEHREPASMVDMIEYRVYVWDHTRSAVYTTPVTTYCTAPIDLGGGIMTSPVCTNYGGDTYASTYKCAWKLRVQDNVITETTLIGDKCKAGGRPGLGPDL